MAYFGRENIRIEVRQLKAGIGKRKNIEDQKAKGHTAPQRENVACFSPLPHEARLFFGRLFSRFWEAGEYHLDNSGGALAALLLQGERVHGALGSLIARTFH